MRISTFFTIGLSALLLFTAAVHAQFEFQDRDSITVVSHPAIRHSPPQMRPNINSRNTDGFGGLLAARFQFVLDSMLYAHSLMGASAAIILPEKGTWLGAGGFSDPVANDSLRTDMLLEIDSNTKSFVASIILQMAEEGRLTLEDQIHQWLPPFANVDSSMTIRQILQHTGGVSDFLNDNPATFIAIFTNPDSFWTPEYSLSWVLAPNFPPGTSWRYSNTGYILAGMIIREIAGLDTFAVPLRQRLLTPLNLQNTYMDIEEPLDGQLAHGWLDYTGDGILDDLSVFSRTSWMSAAWTAGAIVATAEDLAKWVYLLHSGQVLTSASMREMRSTVPIPGTNITYGLGIYTWPLFGKTLWGHDGGGIGYQSQALYYPERGVSLAVMMNQRGGTAWAGDILAELFREVLDYYQRPHDHPYALSAEVNPTYFRPATDTSVVIADLHNPDNHQVTVRAVYANSDSSVIDTLEMFDDGLHDDGLAGDNRFGAFLGPFSDESRYDIEVQTTDLDTAFTHLQSTVCTTVGPVVLDSFAVPNIGANLFSLKLFLRNDGVVATAEDVRAKIVSLDTNITQILNTNNNFGNIAPGQVHSSTNFIIRTQNNPVSVTLGLNIYSEGDLFWKDSLITVAITAIEPFTGTAPEIFYLAQNYPNPFNPSTTIEFVLPHSGFVNLKIYNILGKEVAVLISEPLSAGSYKIPWDASRFASGVYFYKIESGKNSQTKKMLLLQ